MSFTAVRLRSRSLNIVSLSDMIEGSYHSWDLYTTGQLVDGLQQKKENRFSLNGNGIMSSFLGWQFYRSTQYVYTVYPSYDYRSIASTLKMQIKTVQRLRAQLNALDDPLEVVEQKDTARKTQTKEFIEKVQAIIDEIPQQPIRQITRDLGISHTTVNACVKEDLKCRFYRRQTSQILTEKTNNIRLIKSVRPPSSPDQNPLDYFVWSYVENITNMTSHNTKASLIAAIRRVFTKLPLCTCGKGMLPVLDLYRGGDWGWRQLHWIDVSSTT